MPLYLFALLIYYSSSFWFMLCFQVVPLTLFDKPFLQSMVDWLLLKISDYFFGQDRIGELNSVLESHADNGNHVVESPGSGNLTSHIHNEFMVLLACNLLVFYVLIFCVYRRRFSLVIINYNLTLHFSFSITFPSKILLGMNKVLNQWAI